MFVATIILKDTKNNSFLVKIDENTTVLDLKQKVMNNNESFHNTNEVALLFNGRELPDGMKMINTLIKTNDVVDIVNTFLGGDF